MCEEGKVRTSLMLGFGVELDCMYAYAEAEGP